MRKMTWSYARAWVLPVLLAAGMAVAHEGKSKLPPGPIHDRHELMGKIGKQSKKIGEAMKAKDMQTVATEASAISEESKGIEALFPPNSTDPNSRAKPEIWKDWPKFQKLTGELTANSAALAEAARSGGDTSAAAEKMFGGCKSCHDDFRKPEKKKSHSK